MTRRAAPLLEMGVAPASGGRQRASVSRATLAIALCVVALLVGTVVQKAYRLTLPTDGWMFTTGDVGGPDQDRPIYTRNLLGLPSQLQPGDRLLAVGGRPFETFFDPVASRMWSGDGWRAGVAATYTVERSGMALDVEVPLSHWGLMHVVKSLLYDPALILSALLAALGWYVFLARPRTWATAPLLLFSNSLLVVHVSIGMVGIGPPEVFDAGVLPFAAFFSNWIFPSVMFPSLLMLTLTFPSPKRFVARRPVAVAAGIYGVTPVLVAAFGPVATVGWITVLLMAVASLVVLAWSWITVRGAVERAQMRWALAGLALMILGFIPMNLSGFGLIAAPPEWAQAAWFPALLVMVTLGFAVAILRYRLFDIDLVINRFLVYGILSLGVVLLYVGTVGYFGALLGVRGGTAPALILTGLVAVLVQPAREAVQRTVDRWMYGDRGDPYRALTHLGNRLADVLEPSETLATLVGTVSDSLNLPYVAITLADADGWEAGSTSVGGAVADLVRLPLVFRGETVAWLDVGRRRGEAALPEADRRLLADLARQAGAAVYAARLTQDLERSNAGLRAARQRVVVAREEERRRLRRDLHDGLGPALASGRLKIGAIGKLLARRPQEAEALLQELGGDLERIVDDVRRAVYGLRPPALDDLGLVHAIREAIERAAGSGDARTGPDVRLEAPDVLPPLPAAVEVAAYRIVQEALANATRHAHARGCVVRLRVVAHALEIEVLDDGVGLGDERRSGVGILSMRERADEVGGSLTLEQGPAGGGTRLRARLPTTEGGASAA